MSNRYQQAGVSIDAGQQAVDLMKEAVSRTHGQQVLAGVGAFGGLFSLSDALPHFEQPTLVASTDGVGTKVKIAASMGRFDTIGHDIVNHCLNDILCAGDAVQPLFFLDYVASSRLDPAMIAAVVTGIAEACQATGLALLGGETAEMPGVYQPNEFDIVGTIVGTVDQMRLYPRPTMQAGDVLLGLPSSGPHTNGYSLIRHIFADTPWETEFPNIGPLGDALLTPHRAYHQPLAELREAGVEIKGLAHITGGGLIENVPRMFHGFDNLTARIDRTQWSVPPLFQLIQMQGQIDEFEMLRVFNMGIGLVAVIPAAQVENARQAVESYLIGEVIAEQSLVWN